MAEKKEEKLFKITIDKKLSACYNRDNRETHKTLYERNQKMTVGNWNNYIQYLKDWARQHEEQEFEGMSPVCYDEFLDNESEDYNE